MSAHNSAGPSTISWHFPVPAKIRTSQIAAAMRLKSAPYLAPYELLLRICWAKAFAEVDRHTSQIRILTNMNLRPFDPELRTGIPRGASNRLSFYLRSEEHPSELQSHS